MSRYIDADALMERMYHEAFENDASYNESNPMAKWDSGLWIRYKMFENAIGDAPTVGPKRGEWVSNHNGYWDCSECGLRVLIYAKGNFCPNCGADMRERESE